jgi:hypothetical protein
VACEHEVKNCPRYYGSEFHGVISHIDASALLMEEGAYLVRQSGGNNGFYTLTLRYDICLCQGIVVTWADTHTYKMIDVTAQKIILCILFYSTMENIDVWYVLNARIMYPVLHSETPKT